MATDDPIRASDADREVVVATLRDAYTAGRLTLDEFDERMSAAYAGRTWGDLRQLTGDLPVQPVLGADIPDSALTPAAELPSLALQPVPDPDPDPVPDQTTAPARRRPMGMLVPMAVWALLVVHSAVSPGTVFLLIAVFALVSLLASIRRR